jgi:hypothetical protein
LSERGIWEREMEFGCAWASGPVGLTDGTARALHSPRKTLGQGGPLRYYFFLVKCTLGPGHFYLSPQTKQTTTCRCAPEVQNQH